MFQTYIELKLTFYIKKYIYTGATFTTAQSREREYSLGSLDLLRLLAEKPWIGFGPHYRWDRGPRIEEDVGSLPIYQRINPPRQDDGPRNYDDDVLRFVLVYSSIKPNIF